MTQEFTLETHIGTDRVLHLDIETDLQDIDVAVNVSYAPVPAPVSSDPERRLAAFQRILDNPVTEAPVLSLEDMSRESIYGLR